MRDTKHAARKNDETASKRPGRVGAGHATDWEWIYAEMVDPGADHMML